MRVVPVPSLKWPHAGPAQETLRATIAERMHEEVRRAEQAGNGGGLIGRYRDAWPGYFGVILEGGEAGLFTIGAILVTAGTVFGLFRAAGVFGGS